MKMDDITVLHTSNITQNKTSTQNYLIAAVIHPFLWSRQLLMLQVLSYTVMFQRGHYLMVRCASEYDLLNWKRSFYTQIKCSHESSYIRPCLSSTPAASTSPVIVIDLGSTSVRAGVLGASRKYICTLYNNRCCYSFLYFQCDILQQVTLRCSSLVSRQLMNKVELWLVSKLFDLRTESMVCIDLLHLRMKLIW